MRRFTPSLRLVVVLEALGAAVAYSLAMVLRFVDEPAIPQTYLDRMLPWAVLAALIHVGVGMLVGRLRSPRSPLADRPVLPFAIGGGVALLVVAAINAFLPTWLTLPRAVMVTGPLLAATISAALRVAASHARVSPDDLLGRKAVQLDVEACAPVLRGKRVLITGAAGSIGSELARQVLAVAPAKLVLVDTNESGLYDIEGELAGRDPANRDRLVARMGDVTDPRRLDTLFEESRPEVVFHTAAYKHVPLLEANPDQGFTTNVLGTMAVCEAAVRHTVGRVVVISTDKAVRPTSFYGHTKRAAELIAAAIGRESKETAVSVVRFGNVLGSRGSVVPTLLRQIDAGGPITITDPEAYRYFMTISEAASLVLRSAAFGASGAIFVLDMGEEIRIVDLAERLVRMKGLQPGRDVRLVYTGLRPGEKLREELFAPDEAPLPTEHPLVRRVETTAVDGPYVLAAVRSLDERRRAGLLRTVDYLPALHELIERSTGRGSLAAAS